MIKPTSFISDLDDRRQEVINRRVSDDVVLDFGEGDKIICIENADSERIPRRFLRG